MGMLGIGFVMYANTVILEQESWNNLGPLIFLTSLVRVRGSNA